MKKLLPVVALVLIGAGGWWVYSQYIVTEPLPLGLIQANGRVEGDTVSVSSKYPGRITQVLVDEGDAVQSADVLVMFEADTVDTKVEQAEQALEAALHEMRAVQSQSEQTQRDATRYQDLFAEGTATQREAEQAELANRIATEKLIAAQAQVKRVKAMFDEALIAKNDLTLNAPSDGVITNRLHEPGVVVAAGSPVLTIVNLDDLHLKVYIPENQIGKLRLGLPAKIYTDAYPDAPYDATVGSIATQAEFTPKEVQTPDERVKLVYAVKLELVDNPDHRLTPGIPADAIVRWDDAAEWAAPRW